MSNFTFLTQKQCFGDNELDIFKKRGTKAAMTDFSIVSGGFVSNDNVDNDSSLEGRTNDPRGWTSISNILYNFERNLEAGKYEGKDAEDIIRRSIESKLRMEWAGEFWDYYNLPTLTPEEVVQGMGKGYTKADLPRDINERFAWMTALITADEKQVGKCREFIREHCDPEYLEVYDIYWAGNDDKRMEKMEELHEQEESLSLHTGTEAKQFAKDGVSAYTEIGQMYKGYLKRENVIWIVYGNKSFNPCCGKVINITEKQLEQLHLVSKNLSTESMSR